MDLDRILLGRPFPHLAVRLGRAMDADDHVRISPRVISLRRPHDGHLIEQEILRPLPTRAMRAALGRPGTREAWIATMEDGPNPEHPAPPPGMIIHAPAAPPPKGSLDAPFAALRADAARLVRALGRPSASHLLLRRDAGLALSADGRFGGWGLTGHGSALALHPALPPAAAWAPLLAALHRLLPADVHPLPTPASAHARLAWGLPGDLRDALIELLGSADADHVALRAGPAMAILKIRPLRAPSPRALAIVANAR